MVETILTGSHARERFALLCASALNENPPDGPKRLRAIKVIKTRFLVGTLRSQKSHSQADASTLSGKEQGLRPVQAGSDRHFYGQMDIRAAVLSHFAAGQRG